MGDLTPERLALAAHVGDEDAGLACGRPASGGFVLHAWAYALDTFGVEPCLRVGIAAARAVVHVLEGEVPRHTQARDWIRAAERWVISPQGSRPLTPALVPRFEVEVSERAYAAACAALMINEAIAVLARTTDDDARRLEATSRAAGALLRAIDASDEATVRAAVREEVAAWALGARDIVLERVRERAVAEG